MNVVDDPTEHDTLRDPVDGAADQDTAPTVTLDEPAARPIHVAYLEPLDAPGARVRIGAEPVTVGRARSCTVHLGDVCVSGEHALLQATGEGVRLCDLGSTNGTFVDGRRIEQMLLTETGVLSFAKAASYKLVLGELKDARPAAARTFGGLSSRAPAMLELFALLGRFAPSRAPVLVQGEASVGKSRLAKAIHAESPRSAGPFLSVHAATLRGPEGYAELFGDAHGVAGCLSQAEGGTLFIREVAELPRKLQSKLAEVLETGELRPPRGRPRPVNVRLLASTSVDLDKASRKGTFRGDLGRALARVRARVPPLRHRREDIARLAFELCEELRRESGQPPVLLAHETVAWLESQRWPGNLGQLEQLLEQALALCPGPTLPREALERAQLGASERAGAPLCEKDRAKGFLQERLRDLYGRFGGNITRVASASGLDRHTARKQLREMGVHPARKPPAGGHAGGAR